MSKKSPLQRIREEHTSKADLAKKVIEFLSPREGESQDDFEYRISHISNTKLLRLWDNQQRLLNEYGSREKLVEKLVAAKFSNGNEDYAAKLHTYSTTKLLELANQQKV